MKYGIFNDNKLNDVLIDIAKRLDNIERIQDDHHNSLKDILIEQLVPEYFVDIEDEEEQRDVDVLNSKTEVEKYWSIHTVKNHDIISRASDLRYINYVKYEMYPGLVDLLDMDRSHDQETILDYGCGTGNDLIWYMNHSNVKEIIGIDVSKKALESARFRVGIQKKYNNINCNVRLIKTGEGCDNIPLNDGKVDFVNCQGVLMHTSNPDVLLSELFRVLKSGDENEFNAAVMVYNRDSIWFHLWAAYVYRFIDDSIKKQIDSEEWKNITVDEIFKRSTDGVECPLARCWGEEEFVSMCQKAGFKKVEYMGAYLNPWESEICKKYMEDALSSKELEDEHKSFLRKVRIDSDGNPVVNGKYACVSGVYRLYKY